MARRHLVLNCFPSTHTAPAHGEETLSKVEEDSMACDGLHCRLKKAALVALGNFPTFDLDRLQLEKKRLDLRGGGGSGHNVKEAPLRDMSSANRK